MTTTPSICCYCGVGCGVLIESDGDRITGVHGDPEHPANFGRLCSKGSTLHLTSRGEGRVLYPELRATREEPRRRASWDEAMSLASERFAQVIERHGPDAVAFYISGQLLTEDYYVFNKLARGVAGTNNVDTNSRLCMSSAVTGYKATLGSDAPPACYEDIDHADLIFITGSNTAWAHPIVYRRIEEARARRPGLRLIVVDPRRTATAADADLHLQIEPGSDVALYNAMLRVLITEGFANRAYIAAHTENFDEVERAVSTYTPEHAAKITGVPAADIVRAARRFGNAGAALSLYCQGLNQSSHGTDNNATLINLHLATGQIGRPGAGPFSLTGQPNAMGGREVGGMATLLSGHRNLDDAGHRAEVARLWGVPGLPTTRGKTAVELFQALDAGTVKAVWIACTNPAHSMPEQSLVRRALERAEFVVVQEAYSGAETCAYADLLLPAASWGEKEGTMTNSERRISRVRAAVPPPGEARPDWEIAADFARHLGRRLGRDARSLFSYRGVEDVYDEHRETTRGRDLDITGLTYGVLQARGPQQWPFPEGAQAGRTRLYADGVFPTATGRARFHVAEHRGVAEDVSAHYPLRLLTGRLRDQWHTMTRTGRVARLFAHEEEPLLSMHPDDLAARGLRDGDLARIVSRRGEAVLRARGSKELRRGQAFVPMHWGRGFLSSPGANALMPSAFDPRSFQPELKHAAVQVASAELPWRIVAYRRLNEGAVPDVLAALREWMDVLDYAALHLFGRDEPCVALDGAARGPLDAKALARLDRVLGMASPAVLGYEDPVRGISKHVLVVSDRLIGVRLAGEAAGARWLKEVMRNGMPVGPLRHWLLAPVAVSPTPAAARGRTVCSCLDVSEAEIRAAVAGGAGVEELKSRLRCGTQCGSCVPELRRLVAEGGTTTARQAA
jgi:assimilatory nitrate reductase catalytic subunit